MSRICTICARGGSKGIKNKNLRIIAGLPLIAHTLRQATEAKLFEAIGVSSDSVDILQTAKEYGANFLIERPAELATDTAAKIPVIRHCALEVERQMSKRFETYVDLDCTSPLRSVKDILDAVELFETRRPQNVITGAPARRSPYFNLVELDARGVAKLAKTLTTKIVRRQDSPKCFDMNASIYIWGRDALMNESSVFLSDTLLFEMPEERSIDIDSDLDFKIVEMLLHERAQAQRSEGLMR